MSLKFEIRSRDSATRARTGTIETAHGPIETPAFMAVATQASVKALTSQDLEDIGLQLLIANTYHLALRPGAEQVAELGGLHAFMDWQHPLMTDSGGFQVFSLGAAIRDGVGKIADIFPDEAKPGKSNRGEGAPLCRIDEEGVTFRSHLDGAIMRLTPERSMQIQHLLGADFILAFDECTSPLDSFEYTQQALARTHRWAVRCLEQHDKTRREYQSLFGIVQGGAYRELREKSARFIGQLGFPGLAIGGSLGKSKRDMHDILDWTIPMLPEDKPRHLLGIGELEDIVEGVKRGIDLFDCAAPTRWARNGALLVPRESANNPEQRINISNAQYAMDTGPVDSTCECFTCQHYTRAYLHHLERARELVYYRLASIHNLYFMTRFMKDLRAAIEAGNLAEFAAARLGSENGKRIHST